MSTGGTHSQPCAGAWGCLPAAKSRLSLKLLAPRGLCKLLHEPANWHDVENLHAFHAWASPS